MTSAQSVSGYTCMTCGVFVYPGSLHICGSSTEISQPPPAPPTGWKCPVCLKGNAPWSATCGHCRRTEAPTYG